MFYNATKLPRLSLFSTEVGTPTLMFAGLFLAWRLRPRKRLTAALLLSWAVVNLVGGLLSVIPFPFLPFYPEQTVQHYIVHAIYGLAQLPLIAAMLGQLRQAR